MHWHTGVEDAYGERADWSRTAEVKAHGWRLEQI